MHIHVPAHCSCKVVKNTLAYYTVPFLSSQAVRTSHNFRVESFSTHMYMYVGGDVGVRREISGHKNFTNSCPVIAISFFHNTTATNIILLCNHTYMYNLDAHAHFSRLPWVCCVALPC